MYVDVTLTEHEFITILKGGFVTMVMPDGIRITASLTSTCPDNDISEDENEEEGE